MLNNSLINKLPDDWEFTIFLRATVVVETNLAIEMCPWFVELYPQYRVCILSYIKQKIHYVFTLWIVSQKFFDDIKLSPLSSVSRRLSSHSLKNRILIEKHCCRPFNHWFIPLSMILIIKAERVTAKYMAKNVLRDPYGEIY